MKSLTGFLRTLWLKNRLEKPPFVFRQNVENREILFAVYTWLEYHNRARDSYTAEPDTVKWIKDNLNSGDVLWDIGANVGAYSLLAAKLVPDSTVIAFEPYIPTFAHLWENVRLNGLAKQIVPICAAVSDRTAIDKLGISDQRAGSAEHVLGGKDFQAFQPSVAVTGDAVLSTLGVSSPTLMKVDVDGYEVHVVKGMSSLLKNTSLRSCIIEVQRGKTEEPVDALMRLAGFKRSVDSSALTGGPVFNVIYIRMQD